MTLYTLFDLILLSSGLLSCTVAGTNTLLVLHASGGLFEEHRRTQITSTRKHYSLFGQGSVQIFKEWLLEGTLHARLNNHNSDSTDDKM